MRYLIIILLFCAACSDDATKVADEVDLGQMDASENVSLEPDMELTEDMAEPLDIPPISITSWNIVCLRETPEPAFCNGDRVGGNYVRSPEQVQALATHAAAVGTDVFLLQEVENVAAVENILPDWDITTVGTAGQNQAIAINPASGVELVSILSLVDLAVTTNSRQGLAAVIEHSGTQVHILGVHLKAGCARDRLQSNDSDCRTLRQQLQVVQDWIEGRESREQPYLIVGDFNRVFDDSDSFLQSLNAVAGDDLYITTTGLRPTCWDHLQGAPSYDDFIDHHIVSQELISTWGTPEFSIYNYSETYSRAWEYVSDHCPITATFGSR